MTPWKTQNARVVPTSPIDGSAAVTYNVRQLASTRSHVYLRHSTVKKHGKVHTYWRLVRSVRVGGKVVQQTVAQLGELDSKGRAKAKLLAESLTGRKSTQRDLFEAEPEREESARVRLDRIRLERGRTFGDVWLGWTLWSALRLDEACARLAAARPRGRCLGDDGRDPRHCEVVRAFERAAHRRRLVSKDGTGRASWTSRPRRSMTIVSTVDSMPFCRTRKRSSST